MQDMFISDPVLFQGKDLVIHEHDIDGEILVNRMYAFVMHHWDSFR